MRRCWSRWRQLSKLPDGRPPLRSALPAGASPRSAVSRAIRGGSRRTGGGCGGDANAVDGKVAVGGHSYGGRQASMLAAEQTG